MNCTAKLADSDPNRPIFFAYNGGRGSRFTIADFADVLRVAEVRISMDGRGRWMDNVFFERLWQLRKYECVYLNAFEASFELRTGLGRWSEV